MGWKSSDVLRFDRGPLIQGQMRTSKLKGSYNSLIIGPRGLQCKPRTNEDFDLGPLLKSAYNSLIIGPRGLQCEINL